MSKSIFKSTTKLHIDLVPWTAENSLVVFARKTNFYYISAKSVMVIKRNFFYVKCMQFFVCYGFKLHLKSLYLTQNYLHFTQISKMAVKLNEYDSVPVVFFT